MSPIEHPNIISSLVKEEEDGDDTNRIVKRRIDPLESHRLLLHFDINETILLGDVANGDSREESIHKMLAKSAFCKIPKHNTNNNLSSYEETSTLVPTHWWDGQEIGKETSIPPLYTGWVWPQGCCPYYRTSYKQISKTFVQHHGNIYQSIMDQCETDLLLPNNHQSSYLNTNNNHTEKTPDSIMLPAFYVTLHHLISKQNQPTFTLVFRTFGTDLPWIAQQVTNFATGQHPDYPHINHPSFCLTTNHLYRGRWKEEQEEEEEEEDLLSKNGGTAAAIYQLWDFEETRVVASGDHDILNLLDQLPICGIQDDYDYWAKHHWAPTAGKPIWVPHYHTSGPRERGEKKLKTRFDHHILFDDNIHNLQNDGIACIREEQMDGSFTTVDGQISNQKYQGIHLVRVPTIEPVLNKHWFIEQINKARQRLARTQRSLET